MTCGVWDFCVCCCWRLFWFFCNFLLMLQRLLFTSAFPRVQTSAFSQGVSVMSQRTLSSQSTGAVSRGFTAEAAQTDIHHRGYSFCLITGSDTSEIHVSSSCGQLFSSPCSQSKGRPPLQQHPEQRCKAATVTQLTGL